MSFAKSSTFKALLKADNVALLVTLEERRFQTVAAEDWKARPPIVQCRVLGTSNAFVEAERRPARDLISLARRKYLQR